MSTPPADHHRTSLERLLAEDLPRRLRCYDSDESWRDFLRLVHDSGDRVVRRQDTGKWSGQRKVIPVLAAEARWWPCDDCKADFKAQMKAVGRCERVSPGNAARHWLKALLLRGPMLAVEVRRLGKEQGFARETIRRAAGRIGVLRRRTDPIDRTTTEWSLSARAMLSSQPKPNFLNPVAPPPTASDDPDS